MEKKPMVDRDKVLQDIYQRGYELEQRYYGCAQCIVAAVQDFFPVNSALFKAATSFSGGVASTIEGPCGAFSGGVLVLSYFFGRSREEYADISLLRRPGPLVRVYWDKFKTNYGGDTCRQIQMHMFGKAFHFLDGDEYRDYEEAGGHSEKCSAIVGQASVWLAELLLDNNVPCRRR
ncbi:MAG TPA: C-GCAxxG-C-C family protein [Candidatus Limnocylindrales bacterium]|nr:C-GCAxxG-C-C family protein [Candidatus Limnocylindrales bacterium]